MRNVLLLTALFFGLSEICVAGNPELEISVGFSDRFRSGTVTAVSVYVHSPDYQLNANLVLEYIAGTALEEGDRYTILRSVTLSAGTPGIYRFALPLEVSSYPLVARLESRGLILAEEKKELRLLNVDRPLVIGLSRRPSLDALIPVLGKRFDRSIELAYPRGEFLPTSAEAWDGVDLVIWHDLSPEIPDGASLEALGLWIEGGGELILIGGPWYSGRQFPESLLIGAVAAALRLNSVTYYPPVAAIPGYEADEIIELQKGRGRIRYIPRDMVSPSIPEDERRIFWEDFFGE
ncbi:MAG: hypothetical protein DRP60_13825 [Spirochaetes bacterium]|nr:MAG: hypothetical protein DRP60_13825 [Spirochaetota bacterium]